MSAKRVDFWEKKVAGTHGGYLKYMVGEETEERAREIHQSDIRELCNHLPDLGGKNVLELAAGVGYVFQLPS